MKKISFLLKSLFILSLIGSTLALVVGGGLYWYYSKNLPDLITAQDYKPSIVSQIIASDGKDSAVIGEFFKERRYVIPAEKIPERLIQAFISAEDDQFFEHQGINLTSILRATFANFKAGHTVQGGSTITQQVAKSLLLTSEKSFNRKIKEAILANRMERTLTKNQILFLYLNQIYLGHGAYGVQAAAKVYFDKDVSDLSIAECALIAGMPQAPGKFSPHQNPKKAKERQLYVLRRMYENKYISENEFQLAGSSPLRVHEEFDANAKTSPYFVEHIRKYLINKYGEDALYEGGLTVLVKANPNLFKKAGESLRAGLRSIEKRNGFHGKITRFKTTDEIAKELEKMRRTLIMDELGFTVLTQTGELNSFEAIKNAGFKTDDDLIKVGKFYKTLITSFDDKRKVANSMLGLIKIELPFEDMKWAKPGAYLPSQILKVGDQVQVRITKKEAGKILASLEQEPQIQGALYSLDVHSGQVIAMEGGFSFEKSEFNRATQAQRQTGSSYKPIIFSAAIEKGYTPASIIVDSPIVYDDTETGKWKPANYDEKFEGDILLRHALIKSRNIPTIKLVQAVQIPYLIDFSKRLGMNNNFNPDLSIALGSFTTTLEEMTKLYSVFPRGGKSVKPRYYSTIKDRDGKVLEDIEAEYQKNKTTEQVLDPKVAFVGTYLMKEVVNFGTGVEAKKLERPVAGKTGTTNDYMDAWFMGFTPDIVTGVWVGYDTLKPVGHEETGAKASLPIWLEFMKEAVKTYPVREFDVPPGIVFETINPVTGLKSATGVQEAFVSGTEPSIKPQLIVGAQSLNSQEDDKNLTPSSIVTDQSKAGSSPPPSSETLKKLQNSGDFLKEDLE